MSSALITLFCLLLLLQRALLLNEWQDGDISRQMTHVNGLGYLLGARLCPCRFSPCFCRSPCLKRARTGSDWGYIAQPPLDHAALHTQKWLGRGIGFRVCLCRRSTHQSRPPASQTTFTHPSVSFPGFAVCPRSMWCVAPHMSRSEAGSRIWRPRSTMTMNEAYFSSTSLALLRLFSASIRSGAIDASLW